MSNLDTVKGLYTSFANGDIPAVLGALDAEAEWNEADNFPYADGNPYIGPDAVLNGVFMRLGGEWDGFAAVPAEFIDGGDRVVVLGRYGGRYKASGRAVDAQFAHVWWLADGKVTRFQQYTDTAQVRDALDA